MTSYLCTRESTSAYNTNKKVSSFIYILDSEWTSAVSFTRIRIGCKGADFMMAMNNLFTLGISNDNFGFLQNRADLVNSVIPHSPTINPGCFSEPL